MAEERTERRLAAIMSADVAGYSRLMGKDEAGTLAALKALRREVFAPQVAAHHGRIVKLMGDGALVEFPSIVNAVDCAVAVQQSLAERATDEAIRLRIGINVGDIIIEGSDIYGDGVNVAARIQEVAKPGSIALSGIAHDQVAGKVEAAFEDTGEHKLKNIDKPVRVYRWTDAAADPTLGTAGAEGTLPLPDKPSIAVLPFTNMSGDPEQEYFADGISEDIITALSKISKLFVVARNSTFTYKGRAVDVKQVGREQGVRYILEGSVRRSGDRLRITAQLIDATTGHHIWAQRYDRVARDVFALQDEITREVTSALQVELTDGERARLWASGTRNLEAWELVIQIPELLDSHRREDTLPARRLAERALELDEGYATAWAMLGWSHWNDAFNGWTKDSTQSLELATSALDRALSIDDTDSNTLALLAFLHISLRKYDEAYDYVERAMALGPSNSFAAGVAGNVALFCDKPHDMIPLLKKAMRLSPVYPAWFVGDLAFAYLLLNQLDKAITIAEESNQIDPDYIYAYFVLVVANVELGQLEAARAAAENIIRIEPKFTISVHDLSQPYRNPDVLDRLSDGFRTAGIPE